MLKISNSFGAMGEIFMAGVPYIYIDISAEIETYSRGIYTILETLRELSINPNIL